MNLEKALEALDGLTYNMAQERIAQAKRRCYIARDFIRAEQQRLDNVAETLRQPSTAHTKPVRWFAQHMEIALRTLAAQSPPPPDWTLFSPDFLSTQITDALWLLNQAHTDTQIQHEAIAIGTLAMMIAANAHDVITNANRPPQETPPT